MKPRSTLDLLESVLTEAPDLLSFDGGCRVLMDVGGSAVFHEQAMLRIDPGVELDLALPVRELATGKGIAGVVEYRQPATAILSWRLPEQLPLLLSALAKDRSSWSLSCASDFAGSIDGFLLQRPENPNKGEQAILFRDGAGTWREVDESLVEVRESSGDVDQVGYRVESVGYPTIAWRQEGVLGSVTIGASSAWECELLLRLAAACGVTVPDRLKSGFSIAPDGLPGIAMVAARCLPSVAKDLELKSRQSYPPGRIASACTDALRLDRLAGRPDPRATMTLLRLRSEAREEHGQPDLALKDARRLFRMAIAAADHSEAASAAISACNLDGDDRSLVWARRASREAAAGRDVDTWAFAMELLGDSLRRRKRYQAAIRAYENSLRGLRHRADSPRWRIARVYRELAACWRGLDDTPRRIAAERECHSLYTQDGHWEDASRTARRLAEVLGEADSGSECLDWSLRAIDAGRRSGDGEVLAEAHDTASSLYHRSGQAEAMIRHAEKAIASYETMPTPPHEKIATLHERIVESEGPIDSTSLRRHGELAVLAYDRAGKPWHACEPLQLLFRLAWADSRYEDALTIALDASNRAEGSLDRLIASSNLGYAQSHLERHSEAIMSFASVRGEARELRSLFPSLTAGFHRRFASAIRAHGDIEAAIREEILCLKCCKIAQDWVDATDCAVRIAKDAVSLGDRARSVDWYTKAVGLGVKSGNANTHAWALELLGDALRRAERPKDALARYRKAISVLESAGTASPRRLARVMREAMRSERDLGRLTAADRTGTAAFEGFVEDECWFDAAATGDDLADIALMRGNEADRSRWHERTVELAGKTGLAPDLALAHEWIGDTLKKHDRPVDAIPEYLESLRILESWPESPPSRIARIHGELARCHATLGDFTAARESALAALKAHSDAEEPEEAVDLVESLDPAFLADPTARAVKAEAIRLAEESDDDELVRRATDLESG